MDSLLRAKCLELRKMSSNQAAEWLIENYPMEYSGYGEALQLLPHRSWKRADQIRLARYYLKRMPFASSRVYEIFAAIMAFDILIGLIRENLPSDKSDMDLLLYHLRPVLERAAKTEQDRQAVGSLLAELQDRDKWRG